MKYCVFIVLTFAKLAITEATNFDHENNHKLVDEFFKPVQTDENVGKNYQDNIFLANRYNHSEKSHETQNLRSSCEAFWILMSDSTNSWAEMSFQLSNQEQNTLRIILSIATQLPSVRYSL
jgi:hypothetical protein